MAKRLCINPTADAFAEIVADDIYIDKSELIHYTNQVMETPRRWICFSRPRRFGKTFAAQMLAAYYSRGADSKALFSSLKVASCSGGEADKAERYNNYINNFDVIRWDIVWFLSAALAKRHPESFLDDLRSFTLAELKEVFPHEFDENQTDFEKQLALITSKTGRKFYIIIDEWDAVFRECEHNKSLQENYLNFLRPLFKGYATDFVAGAYMTGILPIMKYGTQSALTDFDELTMLAPGELAAFVGFNEDEVKNLCAKKGADVVKMRQWYDGYYFDGVGHVFNPNSVVKAVRKRRFDSYWTQTETYESLQIYLDLNFQGIREAVVDMLGGNHCRVDRFTFKNDLTRLKSRDDVFTLLVHLGYLAYDGDDGTVRIPNEEIRQEFVRSLAYGSRPELVKAIQLSDQLLKATLQADAETVSEIVEQLHEANTAPLFYNNEQALRSVLVLGYLTALDHYRRFEEIASGRGFVDIILMPREGRAVPPIIVELKWNRSAEGAVLQMKEKRYSQVLGKFGFKDEVLLVGVSYNAETKKHHCEIERSMIV